MCYETSQLAYRIYKEAKRIHASDEEIEYLRKRWEELSKGNEPQFYHVSGFSHPKLAALKSKKGKLEIDQFTWGLIPYWVKDELQAKELRDKTLNARGETIFEKPSFREAARSSRLIIPLDGFYEHHHKAGKKYPFYIQRKDKRKMFIGGVSSDWNNQATGELIRTLSIVTTKGNDMMKEIHNNPKIREPRMPLILNDEDCVKWLEGEEEEVVELIVPNVNIELDSHTVKKLRGKEYLGNCEEVKGEYVYEEMSDPPTLF